MVATFEYREATSVEEAVELLTSNGDDAKVLAGGQSLMPLLNLGLAQPSVLVDINRIPGLDGVQQVDGAFAVGALVRHAVAEQSEAIKRACPLLAEAVPLIGDRQVRNRGTIGGSISHADPVAELPTVALCLDAKMRLAGPSGAREVPASDFFVGYWSTAAEANEVLTTISFPILATGAGVSFQELVRRKGDFAIVAAAAVVELAPDRTCRDVRLALSGAASTPIRAQGAENLLRGKELSTENIRQAATAAAQADDVDPQSDVLASAGYRRAMLEVFARRALTEAAGRAAPG